MQGIQFRFYGITGYLIGVIYANDNPTAELTDYRTVWQPDISNPVRTWTLPNLLPSAYTAKWYESTDGVTLETFIDSWGIDGSMLEDTIITRYEYVVDRGTNSGTSPIWADPVSGENTLTDERLAGATYDTLDVIYDQNNFKTSDQFTITPSGGIQLTGSDVWEADVKIIIRYFKKGTYGQTTTPATEYEINEIKADGDFDSTYYSKDNASMFDTTIGVTAFPAFSLIPNGTKARFSTYEGTQRYWHLQFANGDTVKYKGKPRNVIQLGRDEYVELKWKNGKCYVVNEHTDIDIAGEYLYANRKLVNTEYGIGQEVNVSEYQRVYDNLEDHVSYADYDKFTEVLMPDGTKRNYYQNRGKFAISADGTKMKFPDLRGFTFKILKDFSGAEDSNRLSQGAGGIQPQQILNHKHPFSRSQTDIPPPNTAGKAQIESNHMKGGNDRGIWIQDEDTSVVGGAENAMDNIGQLGLVRI